MGAIGQRDQMWGGSNEGLVSSYYSKRLRFHLWAEGTRTPVTCALEVPPKQEETPVFVLQAPPTAACLCTGTGETEAHLTLPALHVKGI